LKPKRRSRIQAREGTVVTKQDQIRAREEASAVTKHLHAIPTARGNFSSKISKSGGERREIEWGEERRCRRPGEVGHDEEEER
jgi:hypothetical protein